MHNKSLQATLDGCFSRRFAMASGCGRPNSPRVWAKGSSLSLPTTRGFMLTPAASCTAWISFPGASFGTMNWQDMDTELGRWP